MLTAEQLELRTALRRFFAAKSPSGEVRRLMATEPGYDPEVWSQMAGQLGLQSLAIPEEYGGAGFGSRELVIVLEELGRALVCAPYFASAVLAAHAVLAVGDEPAKSRLLPGIAAGDTIATLAFAETDDWDLTPRKTTARLAPEWVVDGTKRYVLDGHIADLVLVTAQTPDGPCLFAVDGDAPGLTRVLLPTLDQTRKLAGLEFTGVPARLIGPADIAQVLDVAAVCLAAEQLGGAQHVLDMSVAYAKERHQFGRPIGSFQAIKHKCADLLMEIESARSAVAHAAATADENPAGLPVVARLTQSYCSDAYFHAAAEAIQIHGGIGFTWEHDAHLYFKRAKSSQLLFGDPAHHRRQLAKLIGL